MPLPSDVVLLLRQVANSGYAPLDLMAADLLKKYTQQVGPSEHKNITISTPIPWDDGWPADG